jgi:predicted dithiol-disulfide oxidoreductase (DUF899 family)
MGWSFPWASSSDSSFNFDFQTSQTKEQQQSGTGEYNFAPSDMRAWIESSSEDSWPGRFASSTGTDVSTYFQELPGVSAFVLEDGVVYHTYSAYARGVDGLWGMYQWLDRAPRGRNENFDDAPWFRRHDEYGN